MHAAMNSLPPARKSPGISCCCRQPLAPPPVPGSYCNPITPEGITISPASSTLATLCLSADTWPVVLVTGVPTSQSQRRNTTTKDIDILSVDALHGCHSLVLYSNQTTDRGWHCTALHQWVTKITFKIARCKNKSIAHLFLTNF